MSKAIVFTLIGLFVTLTLVWQADAFFSRDQWLSQPTNTGTAQAVTNPAPQAPAVSQITTTTTTVSAPSGSTGIPLGTQQPTVVNPEPTTVMLLATGLLGMGLWRFRSNKR